MPKKYSSSVIISILFIFCLNVDLNGASIFLRVKRQTAVSTNAETNGQGDTVDTDASAHHYKNGAGIVGMNVTTLGKSNGTKSSSVDNSASGSVGGANLNTTGTVVSKGDQAQSLSDIFAIIEGEKKRIEITQQGKAYGKGDTFSNLHGGGVINNGNGQTKTANVVGTAGGTGSVGSQSELSAIQSMTWDSLMAKLVGSAVAQGVGNAQANMDLSAGETNNNVGISGIVSGTNDANGTVSSQVNGIGNINENGRDVESNMYGSVAGKANSSLLGASSVNTNSTTDSEIRAFVNGNAHSNGNSTMDMQSETGIKNDQGHGLVVLNGTATGALNNLVASNGLKVNDSNGETVAIGTGGINGFGSDVRSNASQLIETSYGAQGNAEIFSNGAGNSLSNDGTNSSLCIEAGGNIVNSPDTNMGGTANGFGSASGSTSNVTGNGSVNMTGTETDGSSIMQANGSGVGPSAARTNANLIFNENGELRNRTVSGGVSATGNNTNVQSLSMISQHNGIETLSNYQKASASAAGSSSASASNSGLLKRRRK